MNTTYEKSVYRNIRLERTYPFITVYILSMSLYNVCIGITPDQLMTKLGVVG